MSKKTDDIDCFINFTGNENDTVDGIIPTMLLSITCACFCRLF